MSERYVVVVGGINIDIGGRADGTVVAADSNPGRIWTSVGGVGHNIAQNLSMMGVKVYMLTALGGDGNAEIARKNCADAGIDLSYAKTVRTGVTSSYLFIENAEGELELGICDAAIAEEVSPEYMKRCQTLLDGAAAVVMDGNIPRQTIEYLAATLTCPIFADPVCVTKGQKLRGVLPKLYALKPNRLEAEMLSGMEITDDNDLAAAADVLLASGLKNVYISCGADGLYAAGDGYAFKLPSCKAKLVNTNGCGDAMTAGLVAAYLMDLNHENTARFALGASALAAESGASISPSMNKKAVLKKAGLISY